MCSPFPMVIIAESLQVIFTQYFLNHPPPQVDSNVEPSLETTEFWGCRLIFPFLPLPFPALISGNYISLFAQWVKLATLIISYFLT